MPPVSAVIGRVLEGAFAALTVLRHPKPIHGAGVMLHGTVRRVGPGLDTGIRWVDEPPVEQRVLARASRSAGLPSLLPDVPGLALRFEGDTGPADIELASTGLGFPSRFWLAAHRSPSRAWLGTLFPYESPSGPVLLAARTLTPGDLPASLPALAERLEQEPWRLRLYAASPRGRWRPFAELDLTREPGALDVPIRFDAVRHPVPGAENYDWVKRVRQPTYERIQGPDIDEPRAG
ncbi:hypothetical protein [Desertivibrio insolitus]|uniref:hypothetical protein n=1 Tax=Herbiconiux sp. SYSU D00978 TaxID=2812562 RepID=UPI001A96C7ED|nr:hypothetical protein [Herbiconiux sp. SYSU D00978]